MSRKPQNKHLPLPLSFSREGKLEPVPENSELERQGYTDQGLTEPLEHEAEEGEHYGIRRGRKVA